MKTNTLVICLCLLAVSSASAQNISNPELLERLGLNEDEMERMVEIQRNAAMEAREAQIELNILQAQLEKLLFPVDVDMREVEELLRASLEWKMIAELAEIRKRVETRKLLGDEGWEQLLRMARILQQRQNQGGQSQDRPEQGRPEQGRQGADADQIPPEGRENRR
jgi:hypothetical protein